MKGENIESINQKITRYSILIIAALCFLFCIASRPERTALNQVKSQITLTNKQIIRKKKSLDQNSPLNQKSDFDLIKAQKQAQDNLYSGITFALGGAKNHTEFKKAVPNLNKLLGKNMTLQLYRLNGEREEVVNDPNGFQFDLLNKTDAQITFSPVTNVHHSQINAVVTFYAKDKNKVKKFRSLLIFDYDLINTKVNSSKIVNFTDSNLSGNSDQ